MSTKQDNTKINLNMSINDISVYNHNEYLISNSKWVKFGINNDYPNYLRDLFISSVTNQAIIQATANLSTGEGVYVVNPEKNPISNKYLNEYFDKETVHNLILDLKIYGYATCQVIEGKIVKYSPAINYRFGETDDVIDTMWYSANWEQYNLKNNKPVSFPIYTEGLDSEISILVFQINKAGFKYYGPVDYNSCINACETEKELSIFQLTSVKNGFFPSMMINVVGSSYSDEQMQMYENQINRKFGGNDKANKVMINFISDKDSATTISPIEQNNLSESYTYVAEHAQRQICVGHGITNTLLVGIKGEANGLGNNAEELQTSYELFYESKLKIYQNIILEGIKKIMHGNLLFADVQFVTYNPFEKKDETKMAKLDTTNEFTQSEIINVIEKLAIKIDGVILNKKIVDNFKLGKLYKFNKSSKNNNFIIKKLEIMDKKDYLFKFEPIDLFRLKNTKDYYFEEVTILPTNK